MPLRSGAELWSLARDRFGKGGDVSPHRYNDLQVGLPVLLYASKYLSDCWTFDGCHSSRPEQRCNCWVRQVSLGTSHIRHSMLFLTLLQSVWY